MQFSSESPPNHSKLSSRAIVLTEIEAMGGAERSVLALCHWLYERELPHHVVTYADHIGLAQHATAPLRVVQLRPPMHAHKKISALRRYFATMPRDAPEPLMSGYQPALHATAAGLRGFHCLMHDTPSLFEFPSTVTPRQKLARRVSDVITGFGLRSGGRTIVTSEYLQAECRRVFGIRADIARMGGLSVTHAFQPRPVTDKLHLLSVSRLETNKRLDWLLRALAALEHSPEPLSSRINWKLDLIGRGAESDTLLTLAGTLGMGSRVRLRGFVPDEALEALYATAHLFVMPAVQGYGIPAIEALSRGIPVLLHRDSGVSDILRDTPWATVFSGGERELKAALEMAIGRLRTGAQLEAPLPLLPTEDAWAERVATLCHWS